MKKKYIIVCLILNITAHAEHQVAINEISLEQIFTTTHVASSAELARINRRCQELDLNLAFRKIGDGADLSGYEVEAYIDVRGNIISIPQSILSSVYAHLQLEDVYANSIAKVRVYDKNSNLCTEEITATAARADECHAAIEKLLKQKVDPAAMPRIAICCSGGGIRATISSAGLMKGLDQEGIFDAILYMIGLSGGTWSIAPYQISDYDHFKDFHPFLIDRIVNGFLHKSEKEVLADLKTSFPVIAEFIIRKLIFKDIPNVIDIYGFCLAESLLGDDSSKTFFTLGLMDQQKNIVHGQRPFPLYTCVNPLDNDNDYDWYTFSPYEVACDDLQAAVPVWSFGRAFENGVSTNKAPHLPLGFNLGLFGSALSISFEELYSMMLDSLEPRILFAGLKYLAQSTIIGETRIFPAEIRNFTYKMKGFPRTNIDRNTFVDGGLDCNIPLPPLLNIDRNIDIIIICDASADVIGAPELKKAEAYATAHHLPFPTINYNGISDKPFTIFDDGFYSTAPVVVYVPMVKNPTYSKTFDPQNYLAVGQFMNTFNFGYTAQQAQALSGLFEEAVHELKGPLLDVMKKVIKRKS